MQLKDSKGQILQLADKPLGGGGEGDVYKVIGSTYRDCCVKIFHPGKIGPRKAKLDYMIKHPLNAPSNSVYRICWPIDFAYKGTELVGFIMPMSFEGSHSLYDINLKDGSAIFARTTERGMLNRTKLLYNISNVINILHQHGYLLADFKQQNILFTDSGKLSMIDIDSVQIAVNGKLIFELTAATAEYAYPKELHLLKEKKPLTPAWDIYSFSIVAYQVLLGIHPFTASTEAKDLRGGSITTPDQLMANNLFPFGSRSKEIFAKPPIHNYFLQLPKDVRNLFISTFDLSVPPPSMIQWKDTLKDTVNNGGLLANMFRANPKVPIFILTSDVPNNVKIGQQVTLTWETFHCDKLVVKGIDRSNVKGARIQVPQDRIVEVVASNRNTTITKKIVFSLTSLFCTRCGTKFEHDDDCYCTYCGTKRD